MFLALGQSDQDSGLLFRLSFVKTVVHCTKRSRNLQTCFKVKSCFAKRAGIVGVSAIENNFFLVRFSLLRHQAELVQNPSCQKVFVALFT